MSNNQPKAQVNLDLNAIPNEVCGAEPEQQFFKQMKNPRKLMTGESPYETCTSTQFTKVFQFKRLSALVSPTGREQVIELQFTKCLACGAAKVIKQ